MEPVPKGRRAGTRRLSLTRHLFSAAVLVPTWAQRVSRNADGPSRSRCRTTVGLGPEGRRAGAQRRPSRARHARHLFSAAVLIPTWAQRVSRTPMVHHVRAAERPSGSVPKGRRAGTRRPSRARHVRHLFWAAVLVPTWAQRVSPDAGGLIAFALPNDRRARSRRGGALAPRPRRRAACSAVVRRCRSAREEIHRRDLGDVAFCLTKIRATRASSSRVAHGSTRRDVLLRSPASNRAGPFLDEKTGGRAGGCES